MSQPEFLPVNGAGQLVRSELERMARRLNARDRQHVGGSAAFHESEQGSSIIAQQPLSFWARITGAPLVANNTAYYPWMEESESPLGILADSNLRSGTTAVWPAVPKTGASNVPINSLVRLYPGRGGAYFTFDDQIGEGAIPGTYATASILNWLLGTNPIPMLKIADTGNYFQGNPNATQFTLTGSGLWIVGGSVQQVGLTNNSGKADNWTLTVIQPAIEVGPGLGSGSWSVPIDPGPYSPCVAASGLATTTSPVQFIYGNDRGNVPKASQGIGYFWIYKLA